MIISPIANEPNLESSKSLFLKFLLGLEMFYTHECLLLKYKVAERALTHKLAEYLQNIFCNYNVDCEYNKVGDGDPKRVDELIAQIRYKLKNRQDNKCNGDCDNCTPNKCVIFPDIIVHMRGKDNKNLLVIEAKTEWSDASQDKDFEKLKALMGSATYRYRLGIGFRFCETFDATVNTINLFMKPDIKIRAPVGSVSCRYSLTDEAEKRLEQNTNARPIK